MLDLVSVVPELVSVSETANIMSGKASYKKSENTIIEY